MKQLPKEKIFKHDILDGEKEAQDDGFEGLFELFTGPAYGEQPQSEKKIKEVKMVFRAQNGDSNANIKEMALGKNSIDDAGSPVEFLQRSPSENLPVEEDEESCTGQCQMLKDLKDKKENVEDLYGLHKILEVTRHECQAFPDLEDDAVMPEHEHCSARSVEEAQHGQMFPGMEHDNKHQ